MLSYRYRIVNRADRARRSCCTVEMIPTTGHQTSDLLEVAETATTGYVKVHGHATFQQAGDLRDFVHAQLAARHSGVLVDLDNCSSVDSTFVGTLTSLTMKYRRTGLGCLKLFNVRPRVREVLATLGLTRVLEICDDAGNAAAANYSVLATAPRSKIDIARLMLTAHETLAQLNEQNAVEFKNVVDYLRAKLD